MVLGAPYGNPGKCLLETCYLLVEVIIFVNWLLLQGIVILQGRGFVDETLNVNVDVRGLFVML